MWFIQIGYLEDLKAAPKLLQVFFYAKLNFLHHAMPSVAYI